MSPLGSIGMPSGYKRLDYIQQAPLQAATGYVGQWIATPFTLDDDMVVEFTYTPVTLAYNNSELWLLGACYKAGGLPQDNSYLKHCCVAPRKSGRTLLNWGWPNTTYQFYNTGNRGLEIGIKSKIVFQRGLFTIDGFSLEYEAKNITPDTYCLAIGSARRAYGSEVKLHSAIITRSGETLANYIPALDPTGRPCMYDLISHQPHYNASGVGEFLYPTESTTES